MTPDRTIDRNTTVSGWRRLLASGFAVFFLLVLVSENIPQSETENSLDWIDRATLAVGFEQGWGVFAPVPAALEVQTHALVTLSDGQEIRWEPPSGNLITGTARFERWRKWSTRVRTGSNEHLWEVNAWRIAEDVRGDYEAEPISVRMVRRWADTPAPGEGFEREYGEFMFYEYDPRSGTGTKTETGDRDENVVMDLEDDLPPLDAIPDPGAGDPVGELPNPIDEPVPLPTVEPRDPAQSTTNQLDPVDFLDNEPPELLPFDTADDLVEPANGVLPLDAELPDLDDIADVVPDPPGSGFKLFEDVDVDALSDASSTESPDQ